MLNFSNYIVFQEEVWFLWLFIALSMVWFASSLAETNQTTFDFSEGESEMVLGFNNEYSSGGFALIFMLEYSSILIMQMVFMLFFLGHWSFKCYSYMKLVVVSFIFIWVRGNLPQFCYDKLMYLAWKSFLPISFYFLIYFMGMKMGFNCWYLVI